MRPLAHVSSRSKSRARRAGKEEGVVAHDRSVISGYLATAVPGEAGRIERRTADVPSLAGPPVDDTRQVDDALPREALGADSFHSVISSASWRAW